MQQSREVLIVGAGVAGLTAASALRKRGRDVLVVEKCARVGGRLAGRRIGAATFDCGAQFLTARDPRFAAAVDRWLREGIVVEWYRSLPDQPAAGNPRWRGHPTMEAIAQEMARTVNVTLGAKIVRLRRLAGGWEAALANGETLGARALVLTPPVPQSLALLTKSGIALTHEHRARLKRVRYDPCLAVLAVLDGPSQVPPPGGIAQPMRGDTAPIAWIADNQAKGISAVPAVTIHASAAFSQEHWDRDRRETGRALIEAAAPWLGSSVTTFEVQAWRYAKPGPVSESGCLQLDASPPLVLAGDALGGPRIEGAALSGWAAADTLCGCSRQRQRG